MNTDELIAEMRRSYGKVFHPEETSPSETIEELLQTVTSIGFRLADALEAAQVAEPGVPTPPETQQ